MSDTVRETAVQMILKHPFFTEMYYTMRVIDDEPSIDTLATDGVNLYVNRPFFDKLPRDQRLTAIAHEVMHKALMHPTRVGARNKEIANLAMDHVVNLILEDNHFAPIPGFWNCDKKYKGWSFEAVYQDLMQQAKQQAQGAGAVPGQGQGQPGQGYFKDILAPKGATKEEVEAIEQVVRGQVARAIETAKMAGKNPVGMERPLACVMEAAEEKWYDHLQRFMQQCMYGEYSWKKLSRRIGFVYGICAPDILGEQIECLRLFIDCSGSIGQREIDEFQSHFNRITDECRPKRIEIAYFDTHIHGEVQVVECGELGVLRPRGGGGTSFCSLFDSDKFDGAPTVALVFTDMYGSFPTEGPEYPVIWVATSNIEGPFGETIKI